MSAFMCESQLCIKDRERWAMIQKLKKAGLFYTTLEYEGSFFFVFLRYIPFIDKVANNKMARSLTLSVNA